MKTCFLAEVDKRLEGSKQKVVAVSEDKRKNLNE